MRILYVITKSQQGGAQRHVLDLATVFHRDGNLVTVVIGEKSGWLHDRLREVGISIEYVRLQATWNPLTFILYLFDLVRLLNILQPDVIHFHSSHTLIGTRIVRRWFPKMQSIVTVHGLNPSNKLLEYYLRFTLATADQIICVCEYDRNLLAQKKMIALDRAQVIHNGIGTPHFLSPSDARSALNLSQDTFVFGTIARFSFQKNLALLIEAFALGESRSTKLCLIGSGDEEESLKQLVRDRKLTDRVIFARGDVKYLNAFSCFVSSSCYEGFPYSLLEATMAHVPVVATKVGGVSELIEDQKTGRLVPSGDVRALAVAMHDAMEQSSLTQAFATAAFDRVQSEFTHEVMIERIRSLYLSL